MRLIILLLIFIISLNAQNYTYLVDKYDKVVDLEAKIVTKIAYDISRSKNIKLYIPQIKEIDKKVYSSKITLTDNCIDADFIFIKYKSDFKECKAQKNRFIFTNNYKRLIKNKKYIGAFFWSKSRPNIVFIKDRLVEKDLKLPDEYSQFIEDF